MIKRVGNMRMGRMGSVSLMTMSKEDEDNKDYDDGEKDSSYD